MSALSHCALKWLLTDKKVDRCSSFPPSLVQMAPVQNQRGTLQVNSNSRHNLKLDTLERKHGAGPQSTLFRLNTLLHWIYRQFGHLSSPSLCSEGPAHEGDRPPRIIQKSTTSFMDRDLSPRPGGFGDDHSCSTCFIMDNDPRVHYEGQWSLVQSRFFSTKHSSTTSGSKASLSFNGESPSTHAR